MNNPTAPGVYIQEIFNQAPSVVGAATSIPAFIGFTEKAINPATLQPITNPQHITSYLEYQSYFGGPDPSKITANIETYPNSTNISLSVPDPVPQFLMAYAIQMFFQNGGGSCYIVSIGSYSDSTSAVDLFKKGLTALKKEDHPTLLVLVDAVNLTQAHYYNTLIPLALNQCEKVKDRFCIFDVVMNQYSTANTPASSSANTDSEIDNDVSNFRNNVVTNNLEYGAAYYPYLQTTLNYHYTPQTVSVTVKGPELFKTDKITGLSVSYTGTVAPKLTLKVNSAQKSADPKPPSFSIKTEASSPSLTITVVANTTNQEIVTAWGKSDKSKGSFEITPQDPSEKQTESKSLKLTQFPSASNLYTAKATGMLVSYNGKIIPKLSIKTDGSGPPSFSINTDSSAPALTITVASNTTSKAVIDAWNNYLKNNPSGNFNITPYGDSKSVPQLNSTNLKQGSTLTLDALRNVDSGLASQVIAALGQTNVIMPPSSTIAGIYATVDQQVGVWKAPANVSLTSVVGPTLKITTEEQGPMNVTSSGKSINAIRSFTGKGTLVWGARTLDGNDNSFRYVSVRRLFNYVEGSIQPSIDFAVFEPNNAMTWLKIRTMISTFLETLWEEGALVGASPSQAFYVQVGLGESMTQSDVDNGNLIVKVGLAVVRPAEFIILQFTQFVQNS